MIQGVSVCHHDRTRTIAHITWRGIAQSKSWAGQILSGAWATSWENLFDNPLHTVITETKLAIEDHPRMWVKEPPEVECGKFSVLSANIEAPRHMRLSRIRVAYFASKSDTTTKRGIPRASQNDYRENFDEKSKDECVQRQSLRQSESKRGTSSSRGEVQGMCLWNLGMELMSGWRFDTGDASDGYIIENQHEEKRMRDIQVGKRGSRAASEEQSDEWRKTDRLEHEALNTFASSNPCVALEYPVSCEIQSRPGSVLVQESNRVDDDVRISALDAFYEMDGRRSRDIGELIVGAVSRRSCRKWIG